MYGLLTRAREVYGDENRECSALDPLRRDCAQAAVNTTICARVILMISQKEPPTLATA